MKQYIFYILLLIPLFSKGQKYYVTDSSATYYITDSSATYYTYYDLEETALMHLNGTVSTINNKIDTVFDENNTYNAIQTDTSKSPSLVDGSWQFDGTDDYLSATNPDNLSPSNITMSAWFKVSSLSSTMGIISNKYGTDYGINLSVSSGLIRVLVGNGTDFEYLSSDFIADTNKWYHVAVTHNSTNDENIIYINKQSEGTSTFALAYKATKYFDIGSFYAQNHLLNFNGTIDEVMIFDRVLRKSEIQELYNSCDTTGGVLNCNY
jgi:hypothetical protein